MYEFNEQRPFVPDAFIPMSNAKKALFIAEQQPDGSIKFVSAGMLFESENPATISTSTAIQPKEDAGMNITNSKSVLTWVVTVLPIVASIIGATTWVNSTIDSKARDNRLELKQDLQLAKQDITLRIDKIEDKVDGGFKDTSSQLNEIKVLIATSEQQKRIKE
ncbi:MAG: hypothetical protein RSC68_24310 [Acinetobacter sp.]